MNYQSDRTKLRRLQNRIQARKGLIGCGPEFSAALHSRGRIVYTGADRYGQGDAAAWENVFTMACAPTYTAALLKDGTLRFAGQVTVTGRLQGLAHVRAVSCGISHMAALLGNGRVVAGGEGPDDGRYDTSEWPVMFDIVCGRDFTVGLTQQGTLWVAGGRHRLRYELSLWENIAGIFTDAEGEHVYAITGEGRLLSTRRLPRQVTAWHNLAFVAASRRRIWAVTAMGQLLSTDPLARELGEANYIACAATADHTVVLTRDGKVIAVGDNRFGQCDTPRFGNLFVSFDECTDDRARDGRRVAAAERAYQARLTEAKRHRHYMVCGARVTACVDSDGRVLTTGSYTRVRDWSYVRFVACGNAHLVALHEDGRVSADGNDTDGCTAVSEWRNIKSIAAGKYHTLGLTEDGRVLFCGRNDCGQGDVTAWSEIRRLYAADTYTVGVAWDGTVLVAGKPPFESSIIDESWKDPVDVAVTATHMVALYGDGTVLSTQWTPASSKPGDGEVWNTCGWRNIRAIAAGNGFTVGLCVGGRVISVSDSYTEPCDTSAWRDVVAVGCGEHYAAGMTADGRMLIACTRETLAFGGTPMPDVSLWRDLLSFACGPHHMVALTEGGQVLSCGMDSDRQCSVTGHFVLFRAKAQLDGEIKYSNRLDMDIRALQKAERKETAVRDESALIRFQQIAPSMRRNAARLLAHVAGNDRHLSLLNADGTLTTYVYETAERATDPIEEGGALRLVSSLSGTVLLYENGKAREKQVDQLKTAPMPLSHRRGDTRFYPVAGVAVGAEHTVVLFEDGTLHAMGGNDRGQGDVNAWSHVRAVAAGAYHTVGLRIDGTVLATGARYRESGNRARGVAHSPRANPCAVDKWKNVKSIFCAGDVTLGLCSDGRVLAAGSSHYGQCKTEGWSGVVSVATSGNHTVALFEDGHVEAVGLNENGECRTEAWSGVIQIAVMPELTLGLCADGTVLAAGRHHEVLRTLDPVRAIACFGSSRQVFVMADGTVRLHRRGSEYLPELLADTRIFLPSVTDSVLTRTATGTIPVSMARRALDCFDVGMDHTATVEKTGRLSVTGANENGQCDIRAHSRAVAVSAGPYHTAAILADGRIALNGRNQDGRCNAGGLNLELDSVGISADEARGNTSPATAEREPRVLHYAWKQVSCGYTHTAALRTDGRVYAVGANPDGRCDTRKWRDVTHLSCGIRHTLAAMADGTCTATGDNRYGQCDVSHWKGITLVAAGEFHSVGLRADGRVEAVGDNRKGQCRVEDLCDIISVACLPEATLCVRADGRVILRGGSGEHDKAVEALREVIAIHTCEHRIAALTADGRLLQIPQGVEAQAE